MHGFYLYIKDAATSSFLEASDQTYFSTVDEPLLSNNQHN
tara:strand:+ start:286 stop:405 length:120 start_codon:yes stop_codon:yes gene_type:complete